MESQIRIALVGCNGRMGKILLEAIRNNPAATLTVATERPGSAVIGLDVGELNGLGTMGVKIVDDLAKVMNDFDIIIDFTRPEPTLAHLELAHRHGKRIVIGTTGFDDAGNDVDRRPLGGNDEMDADCPGKLCQPDDGYFHFLRSC